MKFGVEVWEAWEKILEHGKVKATTLSEIQPMLFCANADKLAGNYCKGEPADLQRQFSWIPWLYLRDISF